MLYHTSAYPLVTLVHAIGRGSIGLPELQQIVAQFQNPRLVQFSLPRLSMRLSAVVGDRCRPEGDWDQRKGRDTKPRHR